MFITNSHSLFYLWWEETLLNRQKVLWAWLWSSLVNIICGFTKKACKFTIKRDSTTPFPNPPPKKTRKKKKKIPNKQNANRKIFRQSPFLRFRVRANLVILVFFTKIEDHNHVRSLNMKFFIITWRVIFMDKFIFRNMKYCRLLRK